MRLRKWPRRLFCLLVIGLIFNLSGGMATIQAKSIAINCSDTGNTDTLMALSDVAGVIPQANWNDIGQLGTSGGPLALVDDSGAGTSATVTFTCNNTWRTNIDQTVSGDYRMMKGYLDYQNNPVTPIEVTINNIPYSKYDLYVYYDGDGGDIRNGFHDVRIPNTSTVIAGPIYGQDPPATHFSGTYIQVPSTSNTDQGDLTPQGNYKVFEGLTAASILVYGEGATFRVQTNGIQIVASTIPLRAGNPDPPDDPDLTGAEIPTNKTMSWDIAEDPNNGEYGAGPDPSVVGHHIYLTTDKAALEAIPEGVTTDPNIYRGFNLRNVTTYTPGVFNAGTNPLGLDTDKEYYWRIDERSEYVSGDPNTWLGNIWTFQTTKLLPVIDTQPQDTAAFTGDPAELSVSVTSATAESYQWKKVDPSGGTDLDVGTDSDTLSFASATVGDEGQYYCVITNTAGPVTSDTAWLDVKRLVGRWSFNGDLTDSAGGRTGVMDAGIGYGGTPLDPNFSTLAADAIEGSNSIEFHDDVTEIVVVPGTDTDQFNFHKRSGLTISCWIKTNTPGWGAPFNRSIRSTSPWLGWLLNANDTSGVMTVREGPGDLQGTTNVKDNEWHLISGTYDPATGESRIYIDGVLENTAINTTPLTSIDRPINFGAEDTTGEFPYDGFVDDARLYNYVLSPFEIAYLYTTIMQDEMICAVPITYDLVATGTSYCIEDLLDAAAFFQTWLECNKVGFDGCYTPDRPID